MLIIQKKGKGMGGKRKRWRKERVCREGERDTAEIHRAPHICVLWTPPLCLLSGGSCSHDIFISARCNSSLHPTAKELSHNKAF